MDLSSSSTCDAASNLRFGTTTKSPVILAFAGDAKFSMRINSTVTRRRFLHQDAASLRAALGEPSIVPRSVFGRNGLLPSERIGGDGGACFVGSRRDQDCRGALPCGGPGRQSRSGKGHRRKHGRSDTCGRRSSLEEALGKNRVTTRRRIIVAKQTLWPR